MSERPVVNADSSVERVARCRLIARNEPWPYAERYAAEITRHWLRHASAQPGLFNGTVLMLASQSVAEGEFSAVFRPVGFKSFYYWRAQGFPEAGIRDSFGSALIRSAEGHVLLGRQSAGNLNAGLSYLPGGFIDLRDVGPDGHIDIAASIGREVLEETGLGGADLERVPGYILTRCGHQVSIGVEYRSPIGAEALAATIHAYLARDAQAELAGIDIVRCPADLVGLHMPPYAELLLGRLFDEKPHA